MKIRLSILLATFGALGACDPHSTDPLAPDASDDTSPDASTPELPPALATNVEQVMAIAIERGVPGISVHVLHPELGSWSGAMGSASLDGDAMSSEYRTRAGSILKTPVAIAILRAVESGELALGDKLSDLLDASIPESIANSDRIDVDMLLSHRTGIPDWVTGEVEGAIIGDPAAVWTLEDKLEVIKDLPSQFEPGAQFGYSNTNYNLLGAVLESVAGKPWREVLEDTVFADAELTRTDLPEPGETMCAECARGYLDIGAPSLLDVSEIDPSMAGAAGGHALVTTPADLNRLFHSLFQGDLVGANTLAAMRSFKPADGLGFDGYGYGLLHGTFAGLEAIGHTGGTAGYQSFALYMPQSGYYVAAFINTGVGEAFLELGTAVLEAVANAE